MVPRTRPNRRPARVVAAVVVVAIAVAAKLNETRARAGAVEGRRAGVLRTWIGDIERRERGARLAVLGVAVEVVWVADAFAFPAGTAEFGGASHDHTGTSRIHRDHAAVKV